MELFQSISCLEQNDQILARQMSKGRVIPEHRLVMARYIDRPLFDNEVVHHINGNKTDNRIKNLALDIRDGHSFEHSKIYTELLKLRKENDKLKIKLKEVGYGY